MKREDLINEIIELSRKVNRARKFYRYDNGTESPAVKSQLEGFTSMTGREGTISGKRITGLGVTPYDTTGMIDQLVFQGPGMHSDDPDSRNMELLLAWKRRNPTNPVSYNERIREYLFQTLERLSVDDLVVLVQKLRALAKTVEAHKHSEDIENKEILKK